MDDSTKVEDEVYITTLFFNQTTGESRAETLKLETFEETEDGAVYTGTETASGSKVIVTLEYPEDEEETDGE